MSAEAEPRVFWGKFRGADKPGGAIDLVNADGLGLYSGETAEQVGARYECAIEVISQREAIAREDGEHSTAPVEIDEERFHYLLNVLPPCRWTRDGDAESFYISEAIAGSVHEFVVRIGDRFWSLQQPRSTSNQAIMRMVLDAQQVAA